MRYSLIAKGRPVDVVRAASRYGLHREHVVAVVRCGTTEPTVDWGKPK